MSDRVFVALDSAGRLLVVLGDGNVERIKRQDPVILPIPPGARQLIISSLDSEADLERFVALMTNNAVEGYAFAARGRTITPEDSGDMIVDFLAEPDA